MHTYIAFAIKDAISRMYPTTLGYFLAFKGQRAGRISPSVTPYKSQTWQEIYITAYAALFFTSGDVLAATREKH